jgi:hypothetical protein
MPLKLSYPPNADETLLKMFERLPPSVFTTPMMAIEIPAAIRPYSMPVAPRSSR